MVHLSLTFYSEKAALGKQIKGVKHHRYIMRYLGPLQFKGPSINDKIFK
jgi:hypothetical protein